jgi:hypothetical protein
MTQLLTKHPFTQGRGDPLAGSPVTTQITEQLTCEPCILYASGMTMHKSSCSYTKSWTTHQESHCLFAWEKNVPPVSHSITVHKAWWLTSSSFCSCLYSWMTHHSLHSLFTFRRGRHLVSHCTQIEETQVWVAKPKAEGNWGWGQGVVVTQWGV